MEGTRFEMSTPTFPSDWPEDCPPANAPDADGDIYRLVRRNPPSDTDFLTFHELGKAPKAPPCLRCGLSVLPTLRDAQHQRALFPRLGAHIAAARLTHSHGKLLHTPSQNNEAHTTWWPYMGLQRGQLFAVVEE